MHTGRLARMPAARREQLVQVAATEFATYGYQDASLNRIVSACDMSKSSFYYVVESKADLFDFVVGELVAHIADKIVVPAPATFAGDRYWERVAEFFVGLMAVSEQEESALLLGRMFYAEVPADAAGAAGGLLDRVRVWVEELLAVGRQCGAVRDDLPEALQYSLMLRTLQVFDEWTVAHYEEFTPQQLQALGAAQVATIERMLST